VTSEEASRSPPSGAFRSLITVVLDILKSRLDLAAAEVEIYLSYLAQTLLWGFATVVCVVLGIFFALTAGVVALWHTHPFAALLGSMGVFIVLAVICGVLGTRSLRIRPQLLSGTLEQLERDKASVSGRESRE
jgi:uncharacterized membrane protein YqjE